VGDEQAEGSFALERAVAEDVAVGAALDRIRRGGVLQRLADSRRVETARRCRASSPTSGLRLARSRRKNPSGPTR
jgi:hypothetical protein